MTPDFNIEVDGSPILEASRVISLRVNDRSGDMSDALEVSFNDFDGRLEKPRTGAKLTVYLGFSGDLHEFGTYIADDCEMSKDRLSISATGFNKSSKLKTVGCYSYGLMVGEAIEKLASRNGLSLHIHEEIKNTMFDKLITQNNESDLHFLTRILRKSEGFFKIESDRLMVFKAGSAETVSGKALPEIKVTPESCDNWRVRFSLREDYKSCEAIYLDVDSGATKKISSGKGEPVKRIQVRYGSRSEAEKEASSTLSNLSRSNTKFSFLSSGNPLIRANTLLDVEGFKPDIDGKYVTEEVTHEVSDGGYKTSVSAVIKL